MAGGAQAAGTAASLGGTAAAVGGTAAAVGSRAVDAVGTAVDGVEVPADLSDAFKAEAELRRSQLSNAVDDLAAYAPTVDLADIRASIQSIETELKAMEGTPVPDRARLREMVATLDAQVADLKARASQLDLKPLEDAIGKLKAAVEATPEA